MIYHISTYENSNICYDTSNNTFYIPNEGKIVFDFGITEHKNQIGIRISLGMACNMKCGYCSEKDNRTTYTRHLINAEKYATALVQYIDKHFNKPDTLKITFWGGEPLLYADVMKDIHKELVELLKDRDLEFGLSTNGLLLTGDNFRWLVDNDIHFAVSYDGPGQYIRSENDILAHGTEQFENLKWAMENDKIFSFNPVLHKGNPTLSGYERFMQERFQREYILIGDAPYMRWYNDSCEKFALSPEQIQKDMFERLENIYNMRNMPSSFYTRLNRTMRAKKLVPFPCITTNREKYLSVDLNGDMWGCHNNVGQRTEECGGNLYGGNIYEDTKHIIPYVALTKRRETRCPDCLMRYMCGGSCGLTPERYTEQNCIIAWYSNFPIFAAMVYYATAGEHIFKVRAMEKQ